LKIANFVKHTSCPDCGSSDGLAVYDDSSSHCFVCTKTIPSEEYKQERKSYSKNKKVKVKGKDEMTEKVKASVTPEETESLKGKTGLTAGGYRGIRDDVLKVFGVRTELDASDEVLARYYPCTTEGELTGWKRRGHPKNFGGSIGNTGNSCDLFGQFRFKNGGKVCLIVGGEEDQLAAYQMLKDYYVSKGWDFEPVVVSPTVGETGCAKQIANQYSWFDGYSKIVIGMDTDDAGKAAIEKIIAVLPKGKTFIANWSLKDPNEMLLKGKEKQFISDFYNAKAYVPVGIMASSDLYDKILQQASVEKTPFPPWMGKLNEMFVGGMPGNAIINIAADTGLGKTTLVNSMVEYWIFNSPHTVGVVSMELDSSQYGEALLGQYIHRKISLIADMDERLRFLKSDEIKGKANQLFLKEDGSPRFYLLDNRDGSVEDIQAAIEELVVGCGVKIIILDPLQDVLDGLSNEEQALFMKWAKGLIKSHGTTLCLINHMRKTPAGQSGGDHESNIMGSSTIIKSASANILLKRDKMSDDPILRNTTEISVTKNRLYGITGPAGAVYYDNQTARLHNLDDWLNENAG
jgi:hypothetical protein